MTFSFRRVLQTLAGHGVEFMVVGGLAGVLQGAPVNTNDVDILYSLRSPNPERLLAALHMAEAASSNEDKWDGFFKKWVYPVSVAALGNSVPTAFAIAQFLTGS